MKRDFKIGLLVGLAMAATATVWFCTMPWFSTETRALQSASTRPEQPVMSVVEPAKRVEKPAAPQIVTPPESIQLPKVEKPARIHIVQKGDSLSSISLKYYGSPRDWPKIAAANRAILPDPNNLKPGLRLVIPE